MPKVGEARFGQAIRLDAATEFTDWFDASDSIAGQLVIDIAEVTAGTSYTLLFEARLRDGSGNVHNIQVTKLADGTSVTQHIQTDNDQIYRVDASGIQVRVQMTAVVGGSEVDVYFGAVLG